MVNAIQPACLKASATTQIEGTLQVLCVYKALQTSCDGMHVDFGIFIW